MRKHPLLNIYFRTLFDWCGIYVLLPLKSRFLASIRFHHCFFTFFYPSVERPVVLHSSFVAGTSRGSSKRNFFCFGFFFVSNFIKSKFSPPSLSIASSSSLKSPESSRLLLFLSHRCYWCIVNCSLLCLFIETNIHSVQVMTFCVLV